MINNDFGGTVHKEVREDGQHEIMVKINYPVFDHLQRQQKVLLTHGDRINELG